MSGHSEEAVKKQIRTYFLVFGALMVLTVVTVAVSYLHLPVKWAVTLALLIATVKASLVASIFMHLSTEKKVILFTLALAFLFFLVLLALPSCHPF